VKKCKTVTLKIRDKLMLWKNLPPVSRIIGKDHAAAGSRAATIAFTIDGMSSSAAVKKLVEKHIAVRNGHFYEVRCLEVLGIQDTTEGIVRISLVHYNAEEEVSRLVEALGEL
jgi:selenocysteine lyase/cysteine desulfurase